MKKIYISGKISGLSFDDVTYKFKYHQKVLEAQGWQVINPLDLPLPNGKAWAQCIIEDLKALATCDVIYMLPDWCDSPGAKIEHAFAIGAGLKVLYLMVYVDNFYTVYGSWRGMNMCHMIADDTTELLLFAEAIGVNLKWIQCPGDPVQEHFDVCLSKKRLAVALGAKDITWRELGDIHIQKRLDAKKKISV